MNSIEAVLDAWEQQEKDFFDILSRDNTPIRSEVVLSNLFEMRKEFITTLEFTEVSELCDVIIKRFNIT